MAIFIIPICLFFLCIFLLKISISFFNKKLLIDKPSQRSNHSKPTPKGAGIILIPLIIFSTLFVFFLEGTISNDWLNFFLICLILTLVSFFDDIYNLTSKLRLLVQFFCVLLSIFFLGEEIRTFISNSEFFEHIDISFNATFFVMSFFLIFFWMWIINLFNFMDGMDGITSIQVCSLAIATNLLALLGYLDSEFQYLSIIILSIFLGFYTYNKPPARIFLGDVGSIPIGYIVGLIIIKSFIVLNLIIPFIIIIMYHLLDSSLTLAMRIFNNENIFQAHSKHFYQKILRSGRSHSEVLNKIIMLNFLLLLLSVLSTKLPFLSLFLSITSTLSLLIYFEKKGRI